MRRLTLALLLALAVAGCGSGSSTPRATRAATLVLDFTPNAVHAGIYSALARGYDRAQGIRLRVIAPSASTDSVKLLETGKVNFAILDIHDLAIARERGKDIIGIMAIVERPLAAVIAGPAISSPAQLVGRKVGVSGLPSDTAVLRSIVSGAGADPRRVGQVTINFNAVPDLLAGRVTAATAFWSEEGVTLQHDRPGFHIFRVDQYRAPAYPELVLCATKASLRADPTLAGAVVRSLVHGYQAALSDPKASIADLESRVPGLDRSLLAAKLAAVSLAFRAPDGRVGELQPGRLDAWSRWEVRFGIVRVPPDLQGMFDLSFVAGT
jgi:ABC-type nitrate/sulfonate/bicarbonate transport system substrate-binding protein